MTLRLGLLPDFAEEKWPSMDLCGGMLFGELRAGRAGDVQVESLRPTYRKPFASLPLFGSAKTLVNADRLLNRMRFYPRHVRRFTDQFDVFHICDHAYANLVRELPAHRTGVFCHDLDTFRCLLEPAKESRPRWFRAMMRKVLAGFRKAALIFHTTDEIRRQILAYGLVEESRMVKAPLGVSAEYGPDDVPSHPESELLERIRGRPFVMHVGSTISRKRIDVLFDVFARTRQLHPDLILLKIGGQFDPAQRQQAAQLGIDGAMIHSQFEHTAVIAGLYRRAAAVLQPSDAEGFGLPVIEALACGAPVLASAIPTLIEVGGTAAEYCPVGNIEAWSATLTRILKSEPAPFQRAARIAQAARFSWTAHARIIADSYRRILAEPR